MTLVDFVKMIPVTGPIRRGRPPRPPAPTVAAIAAAAIAVVVAVTAPENTPHVKFTIKIANGSGVTADANEMAVDCACGDEGKEGAGIRDGGLDRLPGTRILAGRSLTAPRAREPPKSETFLQVEVSPGFDSGEAAFTGNVKK